MRGASVSEIQTPQLLTRSLWQQSGHWDKFKDSMFSAASDQGERTFCLQPISCPGHLQVFDKRVRSYQELPLRFSEFGACHRDEPSGALQGLMRTRAFVQDDAQVFCTEQQVAPERGYRCS